MNATMTETVYRRVVSVIAKEMRIEEREMATADFTGFLSDCLAKLDFVFALEQEFGLEISDADAEKLRTVSDVINYINARVE